MAGIGIGFACGLALWFIVSLPFVMDDKVGVCSKLAPICIAIGLICGIYGDVECNHKYIHSFEASKATIEQSLENESLTGYERVALVEQAAEKNAELAKKQYTASRWYGFTYPDEILELEPILLGGSEG